jgi:hypothetical protein
VALIVAGSSSMPIHDWRRAFAVPTLLEHGLALLERDFGAGVAQLVDGISRLNRLRPITRGFVAHSVDSSEKNPQEMKAQIEVLRKMLLAMVEDIRVVLLRLASRTQTLRYYAAEPDELRVPVARETWRWMPAGQPARCLELRELRTLLPLSASRNLQGNCPTA